MPPEEGLPAEQRSGVAEPPGPQVLRLQALAESRRLAAAPVAQSSAAPVEVESFFPPEPAPPPGWSMPLEHVSCLQDELQPALRDAALLAEAPQFPCVA